MEQTREKILATTRALLLLKSENRLSLDIRWFDAYPIWRVAIVDEDLLYAGFFSAGRKGYESPVMICRKGRGKGLNYAFNQVFEAMWSRSKDAAGELAKISRI